MSKSAFQNRLRWQIRAIGPLSQGFTVSDGYFTNVHHIGWHNMPMICAILALRSSMTLSTPNCIYLRLNRKRKTHLHRPNLFPFAFFVSRFLNLRLLEVESWPKASGLARAMAWAVAWTVAWANSWDFLAATTGGRASDTWDTGVLTNVVSSLELSCCCCYWGG